MASNANTNSFTKTVGKIQFNNEASNGRFDYWFDVYNHLKDNPVVVFEDGSKKRVNRNWIVLNKQNDFYGWRCNIGVDSMMIDPAGIITGACRTRLFDNYNIYDKDFIEKFDPEIKPKICDKTNTCMCQPESLLDKVKV